MTQSYFIHVLTKVRTTICIYIFSISDKWCITLSFQRKKGNMFFFNPHELEAIPPFVTWMSDGFGLRWIVFTKVRALSCGQWVSQLHLLRKMAGIFRNSSIESSDPSSSCSKNSLKYGSVCACVCFCCIEIWRTPETGAWFCFFCRNFGRQVNSKPATKIPDMFYLMLTESDEKIGECVLF